MNPVIWQAIANVFNFALFVAIIAKFAGPAIQKMLETRREELHGAVAAAERAEREAKAALAETEARLAGAEAELAQAQAAAAAMAREQAEAVAAQGELQAASLRTGATNEISRDRAEAVRAVRRAIADAAVKRAEAALARAVTPERQRHLVSNAIDQLGGASLALK